MAEEPIAKPPRMFANVPTIGELTGADLENMLEQLGETPPPVESGSPKRGIFGFGSPQPWQYTTHQFGFIAPSANQLSAQKIIPMAQVQPDKTLANKRINIHLNYLRVAKYPGSGQHRILFTFRAQNQLENMPEPISFSQTFRARDDAAVAVTGYPIFIGLNVGQIGASFQGFTVNVKNDTDEALLGFLDSAPFQSGLKLLKTAQPALTPLMDMTLGVTKALAGRNKNVAVQDFYLGLDFLPNTMGARLATGDYIAAQVPELASIKWDEWQYDPNVGTIVGINNSTVGLPYNYVVFGVSRYPD